MKHPPRLATLLLAATALAGCSSQATHPERQWVESIQKYDLVPIYPPQEDVLPGDVFLVGVGDADGTNASQGWPVRVGRALGADRALIDSYAFRPVIEQESQKPAPAPAKNAADKKADDKKVAAGKATPDTSDPPPSDDATDTLMTIPARPGQRAHTIRLRNLNLPDLTVGKYSAASLGIGAETAGQFISGAFGGQKESAISVSVHHLKELHVDEGAVFGLVDSEAQSFLANQLPPFVLMRLIAQKDRTLIKAVCEARFDALDKAGITLVAANEVVYAHDIDYSFNDSSTLAGALAVQAAKAPSTGGSSSGGSSSGGASGGPSSGGTPPPDATTPRSAATNVKDLVASLNENIKQYNNSAGGNASFGIGTTGAIVLRTHTRHPLAIGMAGVARYAVGDIFNGYRYLYHEPAAPLSPTDASAGKLKVQVEWVPRMCTDYGFDGAALSTFIGLGRNGNAAAPTTFSTGPAPYRLKIR